MEKVQLTSGDPCPFDGRNGIGIIGAPYQNGQAGRVKVIGVDRYEYSWDIDTPSIPSDGNYYATVAGADLAGNAYSGTDSITFTLDTTAPTVTLTIPIVTI